MSDQTVFCEKHGQAPAYMICLHVADGAKPSYIEAASEVFIGQEVCSECKERNDLTEHDGKIECAGCFSDRMEGRTLDAQVCP